MENYSFYEWLFQVEVFTYIFIFSPRCCCISLVIDKRYLIWWILSDFSTLKKGFTWNVCARIKIGVTASAVLTILFRLQPFQRPNNILVASHGKKARCKTVLTLVPVFPMSHSDSRLSDPGCDVRLKSPKLATVSVYWALISADAKPPPQTGLCSLNVRRCKAAETQPRLGGKQKKINKKQGTSSFFYLVPVSV